MTNLEKLTKPFFISVIPDFPGKEDYVAELIRGRLKLTGICHYAMSFPLHPQGNDIYDKCGIQKASFHKIKSLLADEKEIKLGMLFQTTLGHGGYWNLTPETGIEADKITNADGTETHRCCPLDQRFLDYIYKCVSSLCEEHPDFTLGDDDMRMFNGTCFCDRHVKMISELLGKEYAREEIVAELRKNRPHSPVSIAFEKSQIKAMEKLCSTVRKAIDSVDPSIRCGCCIVCNRFDYAEAEGRKLAGDTAPFLRIGNASYLEGAIKDDVYVSARTGFQVVNARKWGFQLLDESDTCPHNRFSKTARTMHLHITGGLLQGLDGGKLWLDQGAYPLREISRPYEKTLGENQYFYRQVIDISKKWKPAGGVIHVPALDMEPYPDQGQLFVSKGDWHSYCLGKMGLPTHYEDTSFNEGISLLSGEQINYYTDEELRRMLSHAALVDGHAAVLLTERGFADMLGIKAEDIIPKGNVELLKKSGIRVGFLPRDSTATLTALPGTEILSEVLLSQYKGQEPQSVMPGSTFFVNPEGGKVIVCAMNIRTWHPMHIFNPGKKLQYIDFFKRLGGVPCYIPEPQDARLSCGYMPDGSLVCAVFNYSYDPLQIRLAVEKAPGRMERLMPGGVWEDIPFQMQGDVLETLLVQDAAVVGIYRLS